MLVYAARGFLGLVYPIAVLLRVFLPQITEWSNFPPQAQAWLDVMKATGYLQILLYTTEFVAGIAILLEQRETQHLSWVKRSATQPTSSLFH